MKKYQISTNRVEIIDELKTDPTENAIGYPSVYENYIAWPHGYVRQDGLYEGYCVLYDCTTGIKQKLVTTENVINPNLTNGYLIAENKPNKTFYDSEVVMLDLSNLTWKYKITSNFSQYSDYIDNPLNVASADGRYCTWDGSGLPSLVIMDLKEGTRYNIVDKDEKHVVNYPVIHNVLTWFEYEDTPDKGRIVHLYYHYLRESPQ